VEILKNEVGRLGYVGEGILDYFDSGVEPGSTPFTRYALLKKTLLRF
jgi:hypothetical protein